jgi:outer membrane lipoprotein-sorting protein
MKLKATALAATALLGLIPAVCRAQDFSADVVYVASKTNAPSAGKNSPPRPPSKVYVSKDKMRLETRGFTGTILLVNGEEHSSVALLPGQKAYQPLLSGPSDYFRVADPDNACPEWQKASGQKVVCEKVGPEVVDGRETVKYQNKKVSADTSTAVWIDKSLKFVVKWESTDAGAELHDIKEAQQSADLFTVPSSYTLLKPQKASSKGFSKRPK